jgi:hypothetical protein
VNLIPGIKSAAKEVFLDKEIWLGFSKDHLQLIEPGTVIRYGLEFRLVCEPTSA